MKIRLASLVLIAVSLSAAPVTSSHVKTVLLEKLCAYQNKTDGLYVVSNGILRVGNHSVDLTPVVETERSAQGKSFVAIRIEVALDGAQRPEFTFGTIGISATQDEAITVGLGEWYLGFGLPLFQAVRGTQATLAVADYEIFAGALGLRGSAAHGWVDGSDAMNRRILEALLPSVSKRADFITLDLKMMVPASGRPKSECRVNGIASVDIASTLLTLNWPRTPDGYIFKQAYILKKRTPSRTPDRTPPSGVGQP